MVTHLNKIVQVFLLSRHRIWPYVCLIGAIRESASVILTNFVSQTRSFLWWPPPTMFSRTPFMHLYCLGRNFGEGYPPPLIIASFLMEEQLFEKDQGE